MKYLILMALLTSSITVLPGQNQIKDATADQSTVQGSPEYTCSMFEDIDDEAEARAYQKWRPIGMEMKNRRTTVITKINVTAIKLNKKDIFGGCDLLLSEVPSDAEILLDISRTNNWFAAIGFNVELLLDEDDVLEVCDTDLYDLDYSLSSSWWTLYDSVGVDGHLNICYTSSGSSATFPWSSGGRPDNMFVHKNTDAGWGWTVAHEIGHWFGLIHTWEDGHQSDAETVTRDPLDPCYNCETNGDKLCDTPADYGTGWCDGNNDSFNGNNPDDCECMDSGDIDDCSDADGNTFGMYTDTCGSVITPDLFNIMAYGCRPCASYWTQGQVDRMWTYLPSRLAQSTVTHASCYGSIDNITPAVVDYGQRVESSGYIISNQTIQTTQYTLYDAANSVDLTEGFTAEPFSGGNVDLRIENEGCYGTYQYTGTSEKDIPTAIPGDKSKSGQRKN